MFYSGQTSHIIHYKKYSQLFFGRTKFLCFWEDTLCLNSACKVSLSTGFRCAGCCGVAFFNTTLERLAGDRGWTFAAGEGELWTLAYTADGTGGGAGTS